MMTPGQRRLYSGDYNYMSQEWLADGSVTVTISGGRRNQTHRLHVKNLWGEQEEVLSEEEIKSEPPEWLKKRLEEATREE